jgi:hypothetical protein
MNWLKDFFFCNTWREFFAMAVLASGAHCISGLAGVCVCAVRIVCYMV